MKIYNKELYDLMEKKYKDNGSYNSCAQIIEHETHLDRMRNIYSDRVITDMLLHDFHKYNLLASKM